MTPAFISLGSNLQAELNFCSALPLFKNLFIDVKHSTVYQTAAVGFSGPAFLNTVISFKTELSLPELRQYLRELEYQYGRPCQAEKFSSRTLDIDLLLYGDVVSPDGRLPHPDIQNYPFVLFPLAELAGNYTHPQLGSSLKSLAQQSKLSSAGMRPVSLACGQAHLAQDLSK